MSVMHEPSQQLTMKDTIIMVYKTNTWRWMLKTNADSTYLVYQHKNSKVADCLRNVQL